MCSRVAVAPVVPRGVRFPRMSARTGGTPPHTPEDGWPPRAAPVLPGAWAGALPGMPNRCDLLSRGPSLAADVVPVACPPAYADVLALVPALPGRPWAHGERLDALARLSMQAELAAITAPEAPEARLRSAHLVLAETARALCTLLAGGAAPAGVGDPPPALDVGARLGLAARVAQMAARLGARLPDESHVAPAHALCAEVHASLL